ncbi:hypothetical protein MTO96_011570 [Rhipicephalus appendiculatus]
MSPLLAKCGIGCVWRYSGGSAHMNRLRPPRPLSADAAPNKSRQGSATLASVAATLPRVSPRRAFGMARKSGALARNGVNACPGALRRRRWPDAAPWASWSERRMGKEREMASHFSVPLVTELYDRPAGRKLRFGQGGDDRGGHAERVNLGRARSQQQARKPPSLEEDVSGADFVNSLLVDVLHFLSGSQPFLHVRESSLSLTCAGPARVRALVRYET